MTVAFARQELIRAKSELQDALARLQQEDHNAAAMRIKEAMRRIQSASDYLFCAG
jgi:hypothetical protein